MEVELQTTQNINVDIEKTGARGYSAYEVAVQNGYVGTETQWLASLKGADGVVSETQVQQIEATIKQDIATEGYIKDSNYVHTDNNYTTQEKTKLSSLSNYDDSSIRTLINSKANTSDIPSKTSQLTNDSNFIDNTYHDTTKQNTLISGTNIKTINNQSILGSGNITISGGSGDGNINSISEDEITEIINECLNVQEPITPVEPDEPEDTINYIDAQILGLESTNSLTNTNKARISTDYISIEPSSSYNIECTNGYLISVIPYTNSKYKQTAIGGLTTSSVSGTYDSASYYIRILIKNTTETEFTDTEFANVRLVINGTTYSLQKKNLVYDLNYIIGGLSSTDGSETVATNRLATDFIELDTEMTKCYIRTLATEQIIVRAYDSNKTFVETAIGSWTTKNGEFTMKSSYKYIRLLIRKSTDADLTGVTGNIMVQGKEYKLVLES